jgi:hypothetical protein
MSQIAFNLHGLLRIEADDVPAWMVEVLRQRLGRFAVEPPPGGDPDIRICRLPDPDEPEVASVVPGLRHRTACAFWRGRRGVFYLRRERPDVGILPGAPFLLACRDRRGAARRLYGMLLIAMRMALRTKGGLLYHGACLSRGETTVLLCGLRGAGKSLHALGLLRKGWEYLADDKLLLSGGRAYLYDTRVAIGDHHLRALPWLAPRAGVRAGGLLAVRNAIKVCGMKLLPGPYASSWETRWDDRGEREVTDMFPQVRVRQTAEPDLVVHVRPGRSYGLQRLEAGRTRDEFAAVQEMMFGPQAPVSHLLRAFADPGMDAVGAVLESSLARATWARLQVSAEVPPTRFADEFERCLEEL